MVTTRANQKRESTASSFQRPSPRATMTLEQLEDDLALVEAFVPEQLTAPPALTVSRAQAKRNLAGTAFAKRVRDGREPENEEELAKEVRELRRLPIPSVRSRPVTEHLDTLLADPPVLPRALHRARSPPMSDLRTTQDTRSFRDMAEGVRNAAAKLSNEELTVIEAREEAARREKRKVKGFVMEIVDTDRAPEEQLILTGTRSGRSKTGESAALQSLTPSTASSRTTKQKRRHSEVNADALLQPISESTQQSTIAKRRKLAKPVDNDSVGAEFNIAAAANTSSPPTKTIKLKLSRASHTRPGRPREEEGHMRKVTEPAERGLQAEEPSVKGLEAKEPDHNEQSKHTIKLKFKLPNTTLLIPTNPFSNAVSTGNTGTSSTEPGSTQEPTPTAPYSRVTHLSRRGSHSNRGDPRQTHNSQPSAHTQRDRPSISPLSEDGQDVANNYIKGRSDDGNDGPRQGEEDTSMDLPDSDTIVVAVPTTAPGSRRPYATRTASR